MARSRSSLTAALVATTLVIASCGVVHRWRTPSAPPVLDLNSASERKIATLPGVTPSMAHRIVEGRPYDEPRALVSRGILTEREFARLEDQVVVKDHGH